MNKLKYLRMKRGLTQEQFAREINIPKPTLVRWEDGYNLPGVKRAYQLAKFFGVSIEELFDEPLDKEAKDDTTRTDDNVTTNV